MRAILPVLLAASLAACATSQTAEKASGPSKAAGEAGAEATMTEAAIATWLLTQVEELAALDKAANLGWWEASTTGTDEAFAKAKETADAVNRFLADRERFTYLVTARESGVAKDPRLARQLDVLWRGMLGKQVEPEMLERITALESKVEQAFNTYRADLGAEPVTQNRITQILRTSTDSKELRAAWEAQKAVGPLLQETLAELVKLRNEVARTLGFSDYYALRMAENDLDEAELMAIFEELDRLTREPFLEMKAEVDARLARRYGLAPEALMPWHYQNPFFQEAPAVFDTGLDAAYETKDVLEVARRFYEGIGLEVASVIERSDLYEKEGKSPHAFAAHIDRADDVRILTNIVPGQEWMTTTVHELGHAVYDVYLDREMPWLLRTPAHALTTEGLAMMMDRQVANPLWAEQMGVLDAAAAREALPEARLEMSFGPLVFSRWTQVMLRFEREMYANPDQDLNDLWWDLKERFQDMKRPEGRNAPDYAAKIHVVIVPVYYQNYMLGELFSAQLHERIAELTGVGDSFTEVYVGKPEVGAFLKKAVFTPGRSLPWSELVEQATGRPLGAAAFARRFAPVTVPAAGTAPEPSADVAADAAPEATTVPAAEFAD